MALDRYSVGTSSGNPCTCGGAPSACGGFACSACGGVKIASGLITDSHGTFPLTWGSFVNSVGATIPAWVTGILYWSSTQVITVTNSGSPNFIYSCSIGTGNVPYQYALVCNGSNVQLYLLTGSGADTGFTPNNGSCPTSPCSFGYAPNQSTVHSQLSVWSAINSTLACGSPITGTVSVPQSFRSNPTQCSGSGQNVDPPSASVSFSLDTGAGTCCQRFTIKGCNSFALPGATVSVYDSSGGTLLAFGTTDASGNCSLVWSGSCTVYVTITAERFTPYGQTLSLSANGTQNITLTPDTGYHCSIVWTNCTWPLSNTLHYTNSFFGNATLTFSGNNCNGTISYVYPGCNQFGLNCPSGTVLVYVNEAGQASTYYGANACPTNTVGPGGCGTAAGPAMPMTSCFVPGVSAFSASGSFRYGPACDSGTCVDMLYCCAYPTPYPTVSATLTE